MALYQITIKSQEDLLHTWTDAEVRHMNFGYIETELEECLSNGDDTYLATYESLQLDAPQIFKYVDAKQGGVIEYVLQPGEYGIKPNSRRV